MTQRNWAWHGKFRWFLLAITAVFVGIVIAVFLDDGMSTTDRAIAVGLLVLVELLILTMHNWITVTPGEVRIGYVPFYRRTIPLREIREISVVTVRPLRDFGGWGIKGVSQAKNGLLLGGHPNRGIKFETFDNRRYVVTFPNLDPIVQALVTQGCTLSAGHGDETSGKV